MLASNSKARKSGRSTGTPSLVGAQPSSAGAEPAAAGAEPAAAGAEPAAAGTPLPGRSVRGSRTGRPVMALLDLLGRRWALRVLWELRDGDALTFRELQSRCGGISSSVLNDRLRELRAAGIAAPLHSGGYELTGEGRELLQALGPVDAWAKRWGARRR